MQRDTRSNYTAPKIPPTPPRAIQNRNVNIMAQGTSPTAGAPPALAAQPAKVETWTMNPMTENFNPGTTSGAKLFTEKTKGLSAEDRLTLTGANSKTIMNLFKVKEQTFGSVTTSITTAYDINEVGPGGIKFLFSVPTSL